MEFGGASHAALGDVYEAISQLSQSGQLSVRVYRYHRLLRRVIHVGAANPYLQKYQRSPLFPSQWRVSLTTFMLLTAQRTCLFSETRRFPPTRSSKSLSSTISTRIR